jgi:hypothetical protein
VADPAQVHGHADRALEASTAAAAVTDPLFSWAGVSLD